MSRKNSTSDEDHTPAGPHVPITISNHCSRSCKYEECCCCDEKPNPKKKGECSCKKCGKCKCKKEDCCCEEKPKPPKENKAKPAEEILKSEEMRRMKDLGLGRGLDATNSKPWLNKSSFQVRRVTEESVLGTEEGGSLKGYEREVTSSLSHQTKLKASIVIPKTPVEVGVDAEHSRTVSSTRRTVGRKVVNRTVSFRSDFDDAPHIKTSSCPPGNSEAEAKDLTFQERLCEWVVKRIFERQELDSTQQPAPQQPKFMMESKPGEKDLPTDPISVFTRFMYSSDEQERRKIVQDCYEFVRHFQVTHYVSSVELGAAEYRVFSEKDFNKTIGVGGVLAVDKIANLNPSHNKTSGKYKKSSDVKTIGKISDEGRVGRGTHDEAVVGFRMQPIYTLIKLPFLRLALQRSLLYYMEKQADTSAGPYLIAFGSEKSLKYWQVNDDYTVIGTSDIQKAAHFYIAQNETGDHPYEFHIAYMGDEHSVAAVPEKTLPVVPRYLNADITVFGTHSGPLRVEYHVSKHSRMLLFGRVGSRSSPSSVHTWIQGDDMFFINCARRRLKKDGYVAMKQDPNGQWYTCCVPLRRIHDEDETFMLFRLIPASYRDNPQLFWARQGKVGANGPGDALFSDLDNIPSLEKQLSKYLDIKDTVPVPFRAPLSLLAQNWTIQASPDAACAASGK